MGKPCHTNEQKHKLIQKANAQKMSSQKFGRKKYSENTDPFNRYETIRYFPEQHRNCVLTHNSGIMSYKNSRAIYNFSARFKVSHSLVNVRQQF